MAKLGEIISKHSTDPNVQGRPVDLGGLEQLKVSRGVERLSGRASQLGIDPSYYLIDAGTKVVNENGGSKIGSFGHAKASIDRLGEAVSSQLPIVLYQFRK